MKKISKFNKLTLISEELENRLLLSADALSIIAESSFISFDNMSNDNNGINISLVNDYEEQLIEDNTLIIQSEDDSHELVIIDSRAPNFQQLYNDIINSQQQGRNIHVVILDSNRDGIEQISEALQRYKNLDAVHIISHGDSAKLKLGSTVLDQDHFNQRISEIEKWSESFTDNADLLLYGCDLASTSEGKALVNAFSEYTGSDVAASDDLTGNKILGGDWDLEYKIGEIETDIAFADNLQENWQGVLADQATDAKQVKLAEKAEEDAKAEIQVEEEQTAEEEAIEQNENEAFLVLEEEEADNIVISEALLESQTQDERRQEIVFIDQTVADYQSFLDDIQQSGDNVDFVVVVLDSSSNGIEQISQVLGDYQDVDAVHIISHGTDGQIFLGNSPLFSSNLDQYSDQISSWGNSFTEDADILIYGCDLAATEDGQSLINNLSLLTGADVAASIDTTGNASLGGDWDLEYSQGNIETNIAISIALQDSWNNVLEVRTYQDNFSTVGVLNGSNGSSNWSGSGWIQTVSSTQIVSVETDAATSNIAMQFQRVGFSDTVGYERSVDLSGATGITTFSFGHRSDFNFNSLDNLVISVFDGTSWTTLATITGSGLQEASYTSESYDISAYANANTKIRFTTNHSSFEEESTFYDYVYIDNVQVSYNVNAAPSVSNIDTDILSYTEGDGVVVIDQGTLTSVADVDSSDFNTGVLTVSLATGSTISEDVLAIQNQGTGVGQISISGSNVSYEGNVIGTFTGGATGNDLVVTFNSVSATPTATAALISAITYENTNTDNPSSVSRTATFLLTDGDGATSNLSTATINITAVNDNAIASNLSTSETYTEDTSLNLTDIVISDVDNSTATIVLTLTDITAGTLNTATSNGVISTFVNGVWTATGAITDINILLAGLTFTPSLNYNSNFSITTNVNTGEATGTKAFTGLAVDDDATATNLSAVETYTEDTPLNLTDIVISDVDESTASITLTLSDTAAGSLNTATSNAVTSTFVNGVWTATGAITDINILLAGLTFTPSLNYNSNFTIATSVNAGEVSGSKAFTGLAVDDNATATNLSAVENYTEDTSLNLTDIVISDVDETTANITLTLSDTVAGSLNTATSNGVTSTFVNGVWTASGVITDINILLAGLTFTPSLNYNSNFTIATSVNAGEASGSKVFTGLAVDDNATATNLSTAENYTEDTPLNLTDIVISDVDESTASITLTLSDTAAGSLNTATSNGVTSTFVNGVWTASGVIVDINVLLAGLTFTPSLNYNSNFAIATIVNAGEASGSKAFTGFAVDDDATATNLSAAETYTEDTALNLTDIVISDVDEVTANITLTLSDSAAGSLSTATSGGVTSTFVGGVWTASGAITDINILLAGLTFTPSLNYNSNFSITTSVNAGEVTGIKSFTGIAVDDDATATNLSAAENYIEDIPVNLTDIVISDVDETTASITLTFSDITAGSLNTATSGGVTSTFVNGVWTATGAIVDINALLAGLIYTPTLNYNSNFTIATNVNAGEATGVKSFIGSADDDNATATNLSAVETYTEDTPLNLTDIVVSDVDGITASIVLTLSDITAGSLNTGTSNGVTSTFVNGVWTATGAITDINVLLTSLTFTPSVNYNSNFNIAISVNAGEATGTKSFIGVVVDDNATATNLTVAETYTEDTSLNLTDIVISDVDETTANITLTLSDVAAGSLNTATSGAVTSSFINGIWTASGAITDINVLLAGLTFTPSLNYNSNFTIATSVNAGEASGVISFTGVAVDDNATATNLNVAETYTEDTALNLTDIVISDVDETTASITLTLSDITAGSLNTATFGAVTSTFVNGVWTASGAIADINVLLAGLTFTPSLNYNSNFTISANVNAGEATGSKSFTGLAVDDNATATNLSAAETYTEDTPLNLTDIVISDVDETTANITLTLSDIAAGSLNVATSGAVTSSFVNGVWTASGAIADINVLLAGLTFTPSLNYNSNFNITTSVNAGEASGIKSFAGLAVDDDATATNLSAAETYTEDTPLNLTDIVISDVDETTASITLTLSDITAGSLNTATSGVVTSIFVNGVWTASGAIADINILLSGLTFTPSLNYNSNFTISTNVNAGEASGSKSFTGIAVDDNATATNLSASETYTEDTPLNLTDIVISDVDETMADITLTLSDITVGSLNTATSGAVTSSFVNGVWTASGAIADINILLAGLTFTPSLNYNSNFSITTNVNAGEATGIKAFTGLAVDDNATATNLSAAETYTEDMPLNLTNIVISDVDETTASITLILSDIAAGSLNTATSGAVTSTFVNGIWTATGAITDINILLADLTFISSLNYDNNFTISTNVNSGEVTGIKNITGLSVNDAPSGNVMISGIATEDQTLTVSNDLVDPEGVGVITYQWQRDGVDIAGANTVNYTLGDLDVNTLISVTASYVDGQGNNTLVSSATVGPIVNINDNPLANADAINVDEGGSVITDLSANDTDVDNAIDLNSIVIINPPANGSVVINGDGTVTYIHDGSETLSDSFSYIISDISGAISNTATVNISINPVNDNPVATDDETTLDEDSEIVIDLLSNDLDIDNAVDLNSIMIVDGPVNGNVTVNGDGTVSYVHTKRGTTSDSFSYTVADISGAVSNVVTVNINVIPLVLPSIPGDDSTEETNQNNQPDKGPGIDNEESMDLINPNDQPPTSDDMEYITPTTPVEMLDEGGTDVTPNINTDELIPQKSPDNFSELSQNNDIAEHEADTIKPIKYGDSTDHDLNSLLENKVSVQMMSNEALWLAVQKMKINMADNEAEKLSDINFKTTVLSGSSLVLTAGVVAWVFRSGALLTSLMSTMPLWKGYDPLPILAWKNNDKDAEVTEDKIPTSLKELKKIKALKEKLQSTKHVDTLFDIPLT